MSRIFMLLTVAPAALLAAGAGTEFEAASIRMNPPVAGFHFAADSMSGGPGTADPALFRCTKCSLSTLIGRAFGLRNYQFPGKASLPDTTFEVTARVPAGASEPEFSAMLQNLLRERFGLAYHFQEKNVRGYRLVVAGGGSKLKESRENQDSKDRPQHGSGGEYRFGQGENHSHSSPMVFGGTARYRGDHQTTGDLARLLSDQLGAPVDDQTGLEGKYDISLTWADNNNSHTGDHAPGSPMAGGHAEHSAGSDSLNSDFSAPSLLDAVQTQLGLKLVPSAQVADTILIIDHIERTPAGN